MDHLLSVNQGPQLKELAFHAIVRVRPIELSQQCQEAITNLPCLEELDLKNWNINNELMANILGKCSSKLKILTLNSIAGFDEKLFFGTKYIKEDLEVTGALPPLQLTSLTNLTMLLDWIQSRSAIYFPILCPALQSLNITVDMDEHDVSQLIKVLQTYCPRLTSIEYHAGYSMLHEYGYYPKPHIHASLFKDSTSCLKSISTGLPHGLDSLMFDALLTHASTLEVIELRCRTRRSYGSDDGPGPIMERVQKLVVQCKNLKRLTLLDLKCPVEELSLLCVEPWECKNLESLTIEGYKSPEGLDRITKTQKMYHKQMRQNAWPRRLRHHEYRWNDDDDSDAEFEKSQRFLRQSQRQSGWFLKAGLTEHSFLEALLDYEVKRKLFSHLGKTSGLKNLRFIQLGKTEFFKDEQPFESPKDEKNEMEMEEDFVVDYRNVAMFKI
ncbi:hypothetical protein BGZ49_000247 [Haplosporangium sp. Z 27]|nr:hypothetical protein BGZ49_000247 [Haplosporangium sp. Z 27]